MPAQDRTALTGSSSPISVDTCSAAVMAIGTQPKPRSREPFDFDAIEVGRLLGRRRIPITDQLIRDCAEAIESNHDWYYSGSPFGDRVAPPTVFDNESLRMLDECFERFGSIHAAQSWQFLAPAVRGTVATVEVRVVDKFVKRDRKYIVMELVANDDRGKPLCRGRHTSLMSLAKG